MDGKILEIKPSDLANWFRTAYYNLVFYQEIPLNFDISLTEKSLRGIYFDGRSSWIYSNSENENCINEGIDKKTDNEKWLKGKVKSYKSIFEEYLQKSKVTGVKDLKSSFETFSDAYHKTIISHFSMEKLLDVLNEKIEKKVPKDTLFEVTNDLCKPVQVAQTKALENILSFTSRYNSIGEIDFASPEIRKIADENAWIRIEYFRKGPIPTLERIIAENIDISKKSLERLKKTRKENIRKQKETRKEVEKIFPKNDNIWPLIHSTKSLIELHNDNMRYWSLAYNDKYYGTFFKELGKKLGTFHTQWLKPQEIIDGLEGSLELPNLVERRRQKGYVLILDNEEIKEFLDLKEAQKHYDLPNPIG